MTEEPGSLFAIADEDSSEEAVQEAPADATEHAISEGPPNGQERSIDDTALDEAAQVVEQASVDADEVDEPPRRRRKTDAIARPYPRKTIEEALKIPTAIKANNNGNPWTPDQVAKAIGMGTGSSFFYLAQASRDYGFTEGGRDSAVISLSDLGRKAVYPSSPQDAVEAKLDAFLTVDTFAKVARHYGGSNLPADEFVQNTLQTQFGLDPRVHEEFLDLFKKNARFVGIGAQWSGGTSVTAPANAEVKAPSSTIAKPEAVPTSPSVSALPGGKRPVCFVIMPFAERTDAYATGFFNEVFASLFKPAIEAAGFEARTAKRQGSDVIQATIINELFQADMVLCDLTEHNPNVLFELGVRMASEMPIALVKATGTNPIFDVDQMLRVEQYNPNLWSTTVKTDVPRLSSHIKQAAANQDSSVPSYLSILRRVSV